MTRASMPSYSNIDPDNIFTRLNISPDQSEVLRQIAQWYPIRVTDYYLNLIDTRDPEDPIGKQVIPDPMESNVQEDERADPLEESRWCPVPGLIHKYLGRVLMLVTNQCAVHCRFCFRRTSLRDLDGCDGREKLDTMLEYIAHHTSIREIILSGGDPLMLPDKTIKQIIERITKIPHIETMRIHTRIPVVLPGRITKSLITILRSGPACWMVIHVNHSKELTPEMKLACSNIIDKGIPLLSQTVLLHGINDSVMELERLFGMLIQWRVKPYYLHLLDHAPGTSHFRVSGDTALQLIQELQRHLPGYAIPRLTRDLPDSQSKLFLA